MQSVTLHPTANAKEPPDPAREAERLSTLLEERRAELTALQDGLRDFKARYASTVGSRLAELAELERAIRLAEARTLGVEHADDADEDAARPAAHASVAIKASLKNLFWSVAKLFHPDHAADDEEARRRHSIMAEASRAYREGDVESLNTLLADEDLQLYCATPRAADGDGQRGEGAVDLDALIMSLKEELLTIEFGIKRAKQDRLYRLKLEADEAAAAGRDRLAEEAARLDRKLAKTRNRLAHLS
jgi:hypothetical protein